MGIIKKILSVLCCTLLVIGGLGIDESFANKILGDIGNDKVYKIESALKANMLVDMQENKAGSNVHLYEDVGQENAQWIFKYNIGRVAYRIVNRQNSSLVLAWNSHNSTNVFTWTDNASGNNSYWIPEDAGNGYIYLKNFQDQSKYLTVSNHETINGTNIHVHQHLRGENAQRFKLGKVGIDSFTDEEIRDLHSDAENPYIHDYWIGAKLRTGKRFNGAARISSYIKSYSGTVTDGTKKFQYNSYGSTNGNAMTISFKGFGAFVGTDSGIPSWCKFDLYVNTTDGRSIYIPDNW